MTTDPISFALAPSMSIDTIVARRDALVAQMRRVREAYLQMLEIHGSVFGAEVDRISSYGIQLEWSASRRGLEREDELAAAIQRVDAQCWGRLLELSGLMQLMDATLRAEWRDQLDKRLMPEFTRANIDATFQGLASQRSELFERGVENVFRRLSWDYKTNSPRKFGKRQIFTYAAERSVHYSHQRGCRVTTVYGPTHDFADKLDDLIRAFCVLDGKPEPPHNQGAWHTFRADGVLAYQEIKPGEKPTKAEGELHGFLRFKGFKNGNAHVVFLRPDLVDHLNRIIARRFPNALPAASGE